MPSYLFYSWSWDGVWPPRTGSFSTEDSYVLAERLYNVGDWFEVLFGGDCDSVLRCVKLADAVGSAPFVKRGSQCNCQRIPAEHARVHGHPPLWQAILQA